MTDPFMQEAIRLSLEAVERGRGGPFGAVVVSGGRIVGRGWNQVTGSNDPTAHAEIVAIREACRSLNRFRLDGGTLYASCEPCPMCLAAAYWARIDRIYYANTREDAAAIGFDDAFIAGELSRPPAERVLPATPLMRREAREAFERWNSKPDKVPY